MPQSLGNGPSAVHCWSPSESCSSALSFSGFSTSDLPSRLPWCSTKCHFAAQPLQSPRYRGDPKRCGKPSTARARVEPWGCSEFAVHHCKYILGTSFIWSRLKKAPMPPAFVHMLWRERCPSLLPFLFKNFSENLSITSRQLWQMSFIHQGVLGGTRYHHRWLMNLFWEGKNGNRGKNLPINVSLKLIISGILLSALCPFHLTKLELALRPDWDNDCFKKVGAERGGKEIMFQINPVNWLVCGK